MKLILLILIIYLKERRNLFEKYTQLVTQDLFSNQSRFIPLWLKLFCRTFKSYL